MLLPIVTFANDGTFTINGNQLIPITETDISIKKEILTINRISNTDKVDVIVYYEFYNPGESKKLLVGFEADFPSGDVDIDDITPKAHPYMSNFTVDINNKLLPYKIACVNDSLYYKNGQMMAITSFETDVYYESGIKYVYYFEADFKSGLNIVKHTYTCELSSFVMADYTFNYVLTAANRWANKQIDDFTLYINMGNNYLIDIEATFFKNTDDWTILGIGKKRDNINPYTEDEEGNFSEFYIKNGYLMFQKKNFKPQGELYFSSPRAYFTHNEFNYKTIKYLPAKIFFNYERITIADDMSKRILKNLPFAHKGYIFKTTELQEYFEKQIWYFPNPDTKGDISEYGADERSWIEYFSN